MDWSMQNSRPKKKQETTVDDITKLTGEYKIQWKVHSTVKIENRWLIANGWMIE